MSLNATRLVKGIYCINDYSLTITGALFAKRGVKRQGDFGGNQFDKTINGESIQRNVHTADNQYRCVLFLSNITSIWV